MQGLRCSDGRPLTLDAFVSVRRWHRTAAMHAQGAEGDASAAWLACAPSQTGGDGTAYRGRLAGHGDVFVKVFHESDVPGLPSTSAGGDRARLDYWRAKARAEATVLLRLSSLDAAPPLLATAYAPSKLDGVEKLAAVVLPWSAAPDLFSVIESHGAPLFRSAPAYARRLIRRILSILARAHAAGCVHGDLRLEQCIFDTWSEPAPAGPSNGPRDVARQALLPRVVGTGDVTTPGRAGPRARRSAPRGGRSSSARRAAHAGRQGTYHETGALSPGDKGGLDSIGAGQLRLPCDDLPADGTLLLTDWTLHWGRTGEARGIVDAAAGVGHGASDRGDPPGPGCDGGFLPVPVDRLCAGVHSAPEVQAAAAARRLRLLDLGRSAAASASLGSSTGSFDVSGDSSADGWSDDGDAVDAGGARRSRLSVRTAGSGVVGGGGLASDDVTVGLDDSTVDGRKVDVFGAGVIAAYLLTRRGVLADPASASCAFDVVALSSCPLAADFIGRLTAYDPCDRPSASEALRHPFLA